MEKVLNAKTNPEDTHAAKRFGASGLSPYNCLSLLFTRFKRLLIISDS